jgi:hypothetical protein
VEAGKEVRLKLAQRPDSTVRYSGGEIQGWRQRQLLDVRIRHLRGSITDPKSLVSRVHTAVWPERQGL